MKRRKILDVNYLTKLPKELLAAEITYLSFGQVASLCSVNKEMNNFCRGTTSRDQLIWKNLIMTLYKPYTNYLPSLEQYIEEKFKCEKEKCWNYNTYTQLVRKLPYITQGRIYLRSGDMDSFMSIPDDVAKIYAAAFENKDDLVEQLLRQYILESPGQFGVDETVDALKLALGAIKGTGKVYDFPGWRLHVIEYPEILGFFIRDKVWLSIIRLNLYSRLVEPTTLAVGRDPTVVDRDSTIMMLRMLGADPENIPEHLTTKMPQLEEQPFDPSVWK